MKVLRWSFLLIILAITLWLVKHAPEPEQVTLVNPASREISLETTNSPENEQAKPTFVTRQFDTHIVSNLFDTPLVMEDFSLLDVLKQPVSDFALPFRYIGLLEEEDTLRLFILMNNQLLIVKQGDLIMDEYQLVQIDLQRQSLSWLHLPTNRHQLMPIE